MTYENHPDYDYYMQKFFDAYPEGFEKVEEVAEEMLEGWKDDINEKERLESKVETLTQDLIDVTNKL
jgi:hypothetical protein